MLTDVACLATGNCGGWISDAQWYQRSPRHEVGGSKSTCRASSSSIAEPANQKLGHITKSAPGTGRERASTLLVSLLFHLTTYLPSLPPPPLLPNYLSPRGPIASEAPWSKSTAFSAVDYQTCCLHAQRRARSCVFLLPIHSLFLGAPTDSSYRSAAAPLQLSTMRLSPRRSR